MDGMADRCPNLKNKLDWLLRLRGLSKSELARRVNALGEGHADREDVTPQSVGRYVHEGRAPAPDVALRIAEVLEVDPVWLFDESQDLTIDEEAGIVGPIPNRFAYVREHVGEVETEALVEVINSRYRDVAGPASELLGEIESIDWPTISREIEAAGSVDGCAHHEAAIDALAEFEKLLRAMEHRFRLLALRGAHDPDRARSAVEARPIADHNWAIGWLDLLGRFKIALDALTGEAAGQAAGQAYSDRLHWPKNKETGRLDRTRRVFNCEGQLGRVREAIEQYRAAGGPFTDPASD